MTGTADWRVNLGWAAVYVAAGWLVILFSRNLERLLEANLTAEEQQRGAIVEERTRFAREIHDTLAQGFTGIMMQLNAAEQRLPPESEVSRVYRKSAGACRRRVWIKRGVPSLPCGMGVLANSTLLEAIEQIGRQMAAESKVKFETRLEGAPYPLTELRGSQSAPHRPGSFDQRGSALRGRSYQRPAGLPGRIGGAGDRRQWPRYGRTRSEPVSG